MRGTTAIWIVCVGLGAATPAAAGELTVEFDFTQSTLTIGGVSIPPSGSITSAGTTIMIPADGTVTPVSGPASFTGFRFNGTVNVPIGIFLSAVVGDFTVTQVGTAFGTFNAAGSLGLVTSDLSVFFGLQLSCIGGLCPPGFPVTSTSTNSVNGTLPFSVNNLSVSGGATIANVITFTVNGTTVVVDLVGTEVTRTFVPEPGRLALLGAGVAALVALRWRAERRGR